LSLSLSSTPETIGLDGTATATINGGTAPYSYLWNDQNAQLESLAVYLNSGWYSVLVTDANGCQISDSVFVDTDAGIGQNENVQFSIYPNPTKDYIQITGAGKTIRIRDIQGKLIQQMNFSNQLNVQQLSSGIYTLEVISDSNLVNRVRFSKVD
jgi:hypothetical protein